MSSRLENAVKAAASLAIEERQLELKLRRIRIMQHRCFKEIDIQFEQGKNLHFDFDDMAVDLRFAYAMFGQHTCQIDVHEHNKRVGYTCLH